MTDNLPPNAPAQTSSQSSSLKDLIAQASSRQHRAADPLASAWVAASAGTGKTRVLTNRFLRLLLLGEPAESLLALTFTKAAASEMANRISDELGLWSQLDDQALGQRLNRLLDRAPTVPELNLARLLFTQSLGLPQGFNIQTIHSFCGTLLKRFPLESDMAPEGQQIDEIESLALLEQVVQRLAFAPPNDEVQGAMSRLLTLRKPEDLVQLFAFAMSNRNLIAAASVSYGGTAGIASKLAEHLEIDPDLLDHDQPDQLATTRFLSPSGLRRGDIEVLYQAVLAGSSKMAANMSQHFGAMLAGHPLDLEDYWALFFTAQGQPRKKPIKEITGEPGVLAAYERELSHVEDLRETLRGLELVLLNQALQVAIEAVLEGVEALKRRRNLIGMIVSAVLVVIAIIVFSLVFHDVI